MAKKIAESIAASISGNLALKLPFVMSMVGISPLGLGAAALGICSQGGISTNSSTYTHGANKLCANCYLVAKAPNLPNNLFIHPDIQLRIFVTHLKLLKVQTRILEPKVYFNSITRS